MENVKHFNRMISSYYKWGQNLVGATCCHLPSQISIKETGNVRLGKTDVFDNSWQHYHRQSTWPMSFVPCANESILATLEAQPKSGSCRQMGVTLQALHCSINQGGYLITDLDGYLILTRKHGWSSVAWMNISYWPHFTSEFLWNTSSFRVK